MKRFCLSILFLLSIAKYSYGQVNLIFNSSFESYIGCPTNGGQIDSCLGWGILQMGGGGTPEYFNSCCTLPNICCGVPNNSYNHSFQYAHSGNAYVGEYSYYKTSLPNRREYIQSKLNNKLILNHIYCVKFYVSLSDNSTAYNTSFGAYFDDGSVSTIPMGIANLVPQVNNTIQPLNDTIKWMKIEGSFHANGNEEYITIGNFLSDSISNVVITDSIPIMDAYYYIDDVSVIDASLPAFAGNDTLVHNFGDSVFIGRQPEVGLDEDCIWFVDGVAIDTIAGMWVKPGSTTTYVVQQTICGNVKYDTVRVTVSGDGVDEYQSKNQWVKVFPNPSDGDITIEYKFADTDNGKFELYDVFGRKVYTHELRNNETFFTINNTFLSSGVYYYRAMVGQKKIGNGKVVVIR